MRAWLGWACAAGLLVAGCGESHGGGSGGGPVPIDRIDDELAGAVCAYLERCPPADNDTIGARILLGTSTTMTCEEAFLTSQVAGASDLQRRVAAGTEIYDPVAARACIDLFRSSCLPPASGTLVPAVCSGVVEGTRAVGQGCESSDECVGDAYCDGFGSTRCGTCMARVAVGAACDSDVQCQRAGLDWGAICATSGTGPGHCVEVRVTQNVAAGGVCGRVSEDGNVRTVGVCAAGLYCTERRYDAAGTCARPVPVGTACESANVPCVGDAFCAPDASGRSCQAVTVRTRVGETCDEAMLVFCNSLDRLECVSGTCQSTGDGTVGSMCRRRDFSVPCNAGLYCDSTTMQCTATKPDGATCSSDSECTTGTCNGTTCGPPMCAP